MKQEMEKINKTIETSLKNLNEIIDINTVIGSPIKSDDGTVILPFMKTTFAFICGGGEYGKVNIFKDSENLPYSAGNGAIVSVKPYGFLIKDKDGYKKLGLDDTNIESLIDKATDLISKISGQI